MHHGLRMLMHEVIKSPQKEEFVLLNNLMPDLMKFCLANGPHKNLIEETACVPLSSQPALC